MVIQDSSEEGWNSLFWSLDEIGDVPCSKSSKLGTRIIANLVQTAEQAAPKLGGVFQDSSEEGWDSLFWSLDEFCKRPWFVRFEKTK